MSQDVPSIPMDARPRLPRGVRLHHDRQRDAWVLLAPETLFGLNTSSLEVLRRCDGNQTLAEILDGLASQFGTEPDRLAPDVLGLLGRLRDQRLLDL
jgi:pyrroloquinoline quinone biosynthesis protein D